jgi:hypothetical protein
MVVVRYEGSIAFVDNTSLPAVTPPAGGYQQEGNFAKSGRGGECGLIIPQLGAHEILRGSLLHAAKSTRPLSPPISKSAARASQRCFQCDALTALRAGAFGLACVSEPIS